MQKTNKVTTQGLIVWIICACFFLYEFFLRTIIGTFQHPIMYDLQLSTFKFSILSSTSYQIIYGLMQIPAGIIVSYYGLRNTLLFAVLICALAAFGFAASTTYELAIFFRILAGLGSSFGFICLLVCVFDWLPHNRSAFYIGLSQFIGTLGPMLAAGPITSLTQNSQINWRMIFIFIGFSGLILSILIYYFVKNNSNKIANYQILNKPEKALISFKKLFNKSQPLLVALFSAASYFFIEYLSENEGKNFVEMKGLSPSFASYMISLSWMGYAIGCSTLGYTSDKILKRNSMIKLSAFAYITGLVNIIYFDSQYNQIIGFLLMGFGAGGQSIGFAIMSEQFKQSTRAIGLGLNNAMITSFSAVNAPVIGYLLDIMSSTNGGLTLNLYITTFTILLIFIALCLILPIFFIKETYCKSQAEFTFLNKLSVRNQLR